jgi:hypothetical protein
MREMYELAAEKSTRAFFFFFFLASLIIFKTSGSVFSGGGGLVCVFLELLFGTVAERLIFDV